MRDSDKKVLANIYDFYYYRRIRDRVELSRIGIGEIILDNYFLVESGIFSLHERQKGHGGIKYVAMVEDWDKYKMLVDSFNL